MDTAEVGLRDETATEATRLRLMPGLMIVFLLTVMLLIMVVLLNTVVI